MSGIVEPCSKEPKFVYSWVPLSDITTCFLDCCHLGCECVVWHKGTDALEEPAVSVFSLDVVTLNVETCSISTGYLCTTLQCHILNDNNPDTDMRTSNLSLCEYKIVLERR